MASATMRMRKRVQRSTVRGSARGTRRATPVSTAVVGSRRALLGGAGLAASISFFSGNLGGSGGEARAALVDELLEKSAANKEANDKHRRRTFDANLARTRTVTDATCAFPQNFFGCENYAEVGNVKFLTDDIKGECEGTPDGKVCRSKVKNSFPSFLGL